MKKDKKIKKKLAVAKAMARRRKKIKKPEDNGVIFDSTQGNIDNLFSAGINTVEKLEAELISFGFKFCKDKKTKKFWWARLFPKNIFSSLLVGLVTAGMFSAVMYAFALPYAPGETCLPGATDCTVTASVPYTGATSAVNLGTRNLTTTGVGSFSSLTLTTSALTVGNGGIGISTIPAGSVIAANALDTFSAITSTTGTKYLKNTSGTITWETIDLSPYVPYTGATGAVALGANTLSTTSGLISPKIYPSADSTTAVQINKADGTTNVLNVDTTNSRVGIGTTVPQSLLDVQGPVGTGTASAGILTLATKELTIVDGDELGRINFNAPLESDGSDAILAGASIWAEADDTFSATVNSTELVFATGTSAAATEKMRIDRDGNVGIGNTAPALYLQGPSAAATPFTIGAGTPAQAAASVAGNNLTLTASNAVAGSSSGTAVGGSVSISAGAGARTDGLGGDGGSVSISAGNGASSMSYGGAVTISSGTGSGGWSTYGSGNVTIQVGDAFNSGTTGTLTLLGGMANYSGANSQAGGAINITAQRGAINLNSGDSTAGAGGPISITGGPGGNSTGAGGTHTGGAGSTLTLTSGAGGNATGASGTRTGGNSGSITLDIGAAGTGASANGTVGNVLLVPTRGNVGIGDSDPTNGKLVVIGGIAVGADALNNNINSASTGDGSTTLYIGSSTINVTAPSDIITKENIVSTEYGINELMKLSVKDFNYKKEIVNEGTIQKEHTGMIAQDVEEVYPEAMIYRSDGLKAIDYNKLIPLIIKSVQDIKLGTTGTVSDGQITGVNTNTTSVADGLLALGATIKNGVATLQEVIAQKVTVQTADVKKLQMADEDTGEIYCVKIKGGEFVKTKGECGKLGETRPPENLSPASLEVGSLNTSAQEIIVQAQTAANNALETAENAVQQAVAEAVSEAKETAKEEVAEVKKEIKQEIKEELKEEIKEELQAEVPAVEVELQPEPVSILNSFAKFTASITQSFLNIFKNIFSIFK